MCKEILSDEITYTVCRFDFITDEHKLSNHHAYCLSLLLTLDTVDSECLYASIQFINCKSN